MKIVKYSTTMNDDRLCNLVKERQVNYMLYDGSDKLSTVESVVRMLRDVFQMHRMTEEHVYLLCFNAKMRPLGVFEVSSGGASQAYLSPREIFQRALLCNATLIIIAHNHPSGDPEPSREDQQINERIKAAGELIGIPLADSIIIGEERYFSLLENS